MGSVKNSVLSWLFVDLDDYYYHDEKLNEKSLREVDDHRLNKVKAKGKRYFFFLLKLVDSA